MDQRRILIVDDAPVNRRILQELLEDDYELDFAADGEECLSKVREFEPELVLLDIMMPGLDGYEVCRRIKGSPVGIVHASDPHQRKEIGRRTCGRLRRGRRRLHRQTVRSRRAAGEGPYSVPAARISDRSQTCESPTAGVQSQSGGTRRGERSREVIAKLAT